MKTNEELPEHLKVLYDELNWRAYGLGAATFVVASLLACFMSRVEHVLLVLR